MAAAYDGEGHLTKIYRYSVTGELTYGSAAYENEYTYNGESYNPNIHSQYLRARYYCVVTANFLTEDSYLGNINEPLTLNRYNYCISSYLNYVDPSGNDPIIPVLGPILSSIFMLFGNTDTDTDGDTDTIDITWDLMQQAGNAIWNQAQPVVGTINSFHKGVTGSIAKAILDKPLVSLMPMAYILEKQYQIIFGSYEDPLLSDPVISGSSWSPTKALKNRMARNETMIQGLAGNLENVNAYYSGRCTGDGAVYIASLLEMLAGSGIAGSGGAALVAETISGVGLVAAPETVAVIAGGVAVAIDGGAMALHQVDMIREDMGRYQESKKKETESGNNLNLGNYKFKDGIDEDFRGGKGTFEEALERAFEKTGTPKEDFTVTKWGKDKYGKSFPVEWKAPNGAEVSVDIGHSIESGAPMADHVGWQTEQWRWSEGTYFCR